MAPTATTVDRLAGDGTLFCVESVTDQITQHTERAGWYRPSKNLQDLGDLWLEGSRGSYQ